MRPHLPIFFSLLALAGFAVGSCAGSRTVAVDASAMQLDPLEPGKFPHQLLDQVLSTYVDEQGLVDYDALKANAAALERYVAYVQRASPTTRPDLFPTPQDRLAYFINAYNAFVLLGVLRNDPGIDSVNDVPASGIRFKQGQGFFYSQHFLMGGTEISLYALENDILRKLGDPRIHAAINCASLGCPRLARHAYHPATLDAELDAAIRDFLAEPRNLRVDDAHRTVESSRIQDWYAGDFRSFVAKKTSRAEASVLDYDLLYTDGDLNASLRRAKAGGYPWVFVDYDWGLNRRGAQRKPVR